MKWLCVFSYEPVVSQSSSLLWCMTNTCQYWIVCQEISFPIIILFLDNGFGDPQFFSRICSNFTCTVLIKVEIKMTSKLLDGL